MNGWMDGWIDGYVVIADEMKERLELFYGGGGCFWYGCIIDF